NPHCRLLASESSLARLSTTRSGTMRNHGSERPPTRLPGRWVDLVLGVSLATLGAVLSLNPRTTIQLLAASVAIGLIAVGVLQVVLARDAALPVVELAAGVLVISLGVVAIVWRSS